MLSALISFLFFFFFVTALHSIAFMFFILMKLAEALYCLNPGELYE